MFSALIAETDNVVPEGVLLALSPEFHMQIQWLPGGRIVNGELLFDEVFEEEPDEPGDPGGAASCDNNAREFLYNLVRTYEDLEYVNIGQVVISASFLGDNANYWIGRLAGPENLQQQQLAHPQPQAPG